MLHRAYIGLGSNIDPERHLPWAVELLGACGRLAAVSDVWQSAPVGFAAQADFLNAAVLLQCELSAEDLVECVIPDIERQLQRRRDPHNKNGPRTIDLDLVLYDRDVRQVAGHTLPDPAVLIYPFVAAPLAQLDADYRHPVTGEPLGRIAQRLTARAPLTARPDVSLRAAGCRL